MREHAFLDNPSDYAVTFVKFSLDSNSFPNQIVQPIVGRPINVQGKYDTIFSIGVGTPTLTPISWFPADATLAQPTSGAEVITKSMISNEYFWNYSYQYFLDRVNETIASLITLEGSATPFFKYDSSTGLISLYSPIGANLSIFVNESLYNLLAGFAYEYNAVPNTVPYYELVLNYIIDPPLSSIEYMNYYANRVNFASVPPSVDTTYNYCITTQSYKSTQLWNPAVSLVFTSKTLGIVSDEISQPYIYGINPNEESNNANVSNSIFEYLLSRRADPTINDTDFDYLFKDLLSNEPQKDLVIEIFWKDDFGNLHPFFIESGSNCSIKLLFRKDNFEVE